jgi:citrate synthase
MGFGHRVYKNFDPRAKIIKKQLMKCCLLWGWWSNSCYCKKIRRICTCWWVFCFKKIISNVDFYSGIIYRALEFLLICLQLCLLLGVYRLDCTMERNERKQEPIGRPRQIYTGHLWGILKHPTKDKFTLKASLFCEAFFIFVKSYYMWVKRT